MALTPKQEVFCQAYIETGNASEAYRRVYSPKGKPATVNRSAHEVLENPKVAARLAELKDAQKERHHVTVDSLLLELEEARKVGIATGRAAAMVAATMSKAKLLGMEGSTPDDETPTSVKVTVQVQDARRGSRDQATT